ncbi:allantoate amidohydrolase [Mesorhizobium sp. BR1-1-16]|uniref:allantoate amidohydrolase n=1 Tax=Mesorhizobium sp. BR1-1-16 TaxID=2876653 RepID=UPI001CCCCD26|nr:allantoate amidohydrolase [Mesorhizobium sp. BR1-1-16]MBZ9938816.1 allantoate amidohydrolase [Mesorhizobium sp. BR1-1-16]
MSVSDRSEAQRAWRRLEALAACTDEPGRITRLAFSPALKRANALVLGWMREIGMTASIDPAGNVVGRYEGLSVDAPTIMLGSHLDTVRDGGRYDGPLGVIAGLAVVERLASASRRLPAAIEIVGFADEEGTRFGGSVLGSMAMAGIVPPDWPARVDIDGVSAGKAVIAFGLDPARISEASRRQKAPLAYVELHIEQGPILEGRDAALGCVTGIAGALRAKVTVSGKAGHAGTVPMDMRADSLVAASECILAVERVAKQFQCIATVGQIRCHPNATNVIAGSVTFSLDIRSLEDGSKSAAVADIVRAFAAIAENRRLRVETEVTSNTDATLCDARLTGIIRDVLAEIGPTVVELPSGAGHDGLNMAHIAPIAMIFVRCKDGLSHHPDESITIDDLAIGIDALSATCTMAAAG